MLRKRKGVQGVTREPGDSLTGETDWLWLGAMSSEERYRAALADPDNPPRSAKWLAGGRLVVPLAPWDHPSEAAAAAIRAAAGRVAEARGLLGALIGYMIGRLN